MRGGFKERIKRLLFGGERFKKEFRAQLRLLIMFTLGFTIAFTWRQTFFDLGESLISRITTIQGEALLSLTTSIFITIVGLILIYLTSHVLKDRPDN